MFNFLKLGLLKKGVLTKEYPYETFEPFEGTLGLPAVNMETCDQCGRCVSVCPTAAISTVPNGLEISLQRCIFCSACADACPSITMTKRFELASKCKDDLKVVYLHE